MVRYTRCRSPAMVRSVTLCPREEPSELGFRPPCSFFLEVFSDAVFSDADGASQGNFCKIITVETCDVLLVRAGDGFLRLHHFHGIGDTRGESIAGLDKRLF